MRWRFIESRDARESSERSKVIAKIDSWWREFQDKSQEIGALFSRKANWDLPDWMGQHLGAIHPSLMWEYGPAVRGTGHRLVITPESMHYLRPLVRAILERAPVLHGWEFYEYRLPEDFRQTRLAVQGRTGSDISDFKVRVSRGEQQRIDLEYTSPTIADRDDPTGFNAAFIATETLLGEQCLDNWVGKIEVTPLARTGRLGSLFRRRTNGVPHFIELDRLQETVNALIGSMLEQLPQAPHYEWAENATWTMWELKPEQTDDYCEQGDLFVGKSPNPTMWTAAHSGSLFASQRFSRCGETFCYVKLDGTEGTREEVFADKSEIEDELDAVLKPDKLGCQIGGGTGLRYSYIDLALLDVDRGIQAARHRLRTGKVPKRSWIQFYDSDLAAEWVGIYEDSPPPPMDLDA